MHSARSRGLRKKRDRARVAHFACRCRALDCRRARVPSRGQRGLLHDGPSLLGKGCFDRGHTRSRYQARSRRAVQRADERLAEVGANTRQIRARRRAARRRMHEHPHDSGREPCRWDRSARWVGPAPQVGGSDDHFGLRWTARRRDCCWHPRSSIRWPRQRTRSRRPLLYDSRKAEPPHPCGCGT